LDSFVLAMRAYIEGCRKRWRAPASEGHNTHEKRQQTGKNYAASVKHAVTPFGSDFGVHDKTPVTHFRGTSSTI
jgi:hypothetical protein